MNTYNWSALSDHDFERVCQDVMTEVVGKPIEMFARGADGGVDLRFSDSTQLIVGQAKHYLESTHAQLTAALQKEVTSLKKLARTPNRYMLFTSKSLSPSRKTKFRTMIGASCLSEADIFGVDDIERVIRNNKLIEQNHFKLWLCGVSVLTSIQSSAIRSRSRFRVEQILDRSKYLVIPDALKPANTKLRDNRCLIISGVPGIGKTTLAEMISLQFLANGYTAHFASSVDEIESSYDEEADQLFIYDDFLGRTNLAEAPPASTQERLFSIMGHFRTRKNKFLILTTREYLFREASTINDRFRQSRADVLKTLVKVESYSSSDRAQILYNYLYWNRSIPKDALVDFVDRKSYQKIIDHPHFNPRFIVDTLNRLAPHHPDPLGSI